MEFSNFLGFFQNVKPVGKNQWKADCPSCGAKGHLYIAEAEDGKALLDCKKGCTFSEIISAAGLKKSDCFPENNARKKEPWKLLREHVYTGENGEILAKKQIFDVGSGNKQAVWYRLEKGQFVKGLGGAKMPLYHLEKLVRSDAEIVLVVEGEKDVETAERLGFTATTSPGGASAKWGGYFAKYFSRKNVAIITDNDDPGRKYGTEVAAAILPLAASVKIIGAEKLYPNVKKKGDISDIAAELGDADTIRLLNAAIAATEPISASANFCENKFISENIPENSAISEKLRTLTPEKKFPFNDKGNGALFAAVFGDIARYNVTAKEWYVFRDGFWQCDTGGMHVMGLAKQLHNELLRYAATIPDESLQRGFSENVGKMGRLNVRETMIKDARDQRFFSSSDLDKNQWLFNCKNGTYDLKNGKFLPHDPDDLISKMSNVFYDENAKSPEFEKYFDEILCGNEEKKSYLLKALGYSLTGDTSQECMFILYGSTSRNGKGTLMETIMHMMGGEAGYAMSAAPETLARKQNKDSRQASGDIARLKGARFLNVSEPPKNMVFDAALLKTLTGRDTITARHLHEREFQFVPDFKLFINTNYLPHVNDDTVFSSERINVITFDRHFPDEEQDKNLKNKLRTPENISGIFNICLGGLRDYLENGLRRPQAVLLATEEYRRNSDRQGVFISECLEKDANSNVKAKDVYEIYLKWCRENNYKAENKSNFISGLRTKNMLSEQAYMNGMTFHNVIRGYRICEDYLPEQPYEPPF